MIERLESPSADDLDALTQLWEASVRATHDFLAPGDIAFFRQLVREQALSEVDLSIIRDKAGVIVAFMGLNLPKIEMLFVDPAQRRSGLGRELVEYALGLGVRQVDVNEQNAQAAGFYARMGFRPVGRDALDSSGRPYPILHLER